MAEILSNPETWVALGFVAFVALVAKRAYQFITGLLDQRSEAIKKSLDEAVRLREEAQALLAGYERQQRNAEQDAEEIIARAQREAQSMAEDAAEAIEAAVARRSELAMERIAQAEAKALREVRETAIDVAVRSAERLIAEQLDEAKANQMVDDAIKDLGKKLH